MDTYSDKKIRLGLDMRRSGFLCLRKRKGFTLIEVILVIAILGIIAAIGVPLIISASDSLSFLTVRTEMAQSADVAMSKMLIDIRRIKNNLSVVTATASQFRFLDVANTNINYYLNGNNLMRNSDILAGNVQGLTFSYYNKNGSQLNPPTVGIGTVTNIYRVKILLTLQNGSYVFNYQTQVKPRNLR
ncbi:MAG: prepilin-type N-terminal cleavage/methylation domain-containing protein [Candidatus Omnitrophica bacterium]|nr:prepilin-type N-terminal cleavage/methylation domain-containing protein [Candidatus Omnitrophota bacterium]MDD5352143.1 prepilin-type N-terminal cleavage/methylation domain-containing protein [Candidatus Omnitrophota bacterium]MDD5549741.1 prepilin-type N-terminal cleavage/methylation domain-containing protein [Candidatus Omnitrophota bacterium]